MRFARQMNALELINQYVKTTFLDMKKVILKLVKYKS